MKILALDPGTFETGYVIFDSETKRVIAADILKNMEMLLRIKYTAINKEADDIAIEMIASYGMPVGAEVFETCVWIGKFCQTWESLMLTEAQRVFRKDVKNYLCGTTKAKDGNIRQRLLDMFGEVGTKKTPGPLFGVKSHCWAALAVAATALRV